MARQKSSGPSGPSQSGPLKSSGPSQSVALLISETYRFGGFVLRFRSPVDQASTAAIVASLEKAIGHATTTWESPVRCSAVPKAWNRQYSVPRWKQMIGRLPSAAEQIHHHAPLIAITSSSDRSYDELCDDELEWIVAHEYPEIAGREAAALKANDHKALRAALDARRVVAPVREQLRASLAEAPGDRELWRVVGDELLANGDHSGELLVASDDDPRRPELVHRHGLPTEIVARVIEPPRYGQALALAQLHARLGDKLLDPLIAAADHLDRRRIPRALMLELVNAALDKPPRSIGRTKMLGHARELAIADPTGFGDSLGSAAYSAHGDWKRALALYDLMIDAQGLTLSNYNNALWAVMADNNGLPLNAKRQRRFLAACLPYGPQNPGIFYNAACGYFELGDTEKTLEMIELALRHGYSEPDNIRNEPLFEPISQDPRFVAIFEAPRGAPNRRYGGVWTPSKRKSRQRKRSAD